MLRNKVVCDVIIAVCHVEKKDYHEDHGVVVGARFTHKNTT